MKYTVYKIINQINSKIYVGCHKTNNLEDNYMGSGVNIIKAMNKYGIENFKKEYIAIFDNPEDMFKMESQLVNENFIKSGSTYNMKVGGIGSWDYANTNYWSDDKRKEHNKIAGSWKNKSKRIKILETIPMEKRKKIGKSMGDKYGGQNKLTKIEVMNRLQEIKDIDLTKYGWVKKVSNILNMSHTQVKRFMDKHYKGETYKRK